jgi:hypothetical protein
VYRNSGLWPILVATFAGLNSLYFSVWRVLQAKTEATPQANSTTLCPSIAIGTGLARSRIYPQNLALLPPPPLRKMKFKLNRWITNSPTHTNQYFSGYHKLQKDMNEGLYSEKKHGKVHD